MKATCTSTYTPWSHLMSCEQQRAPLEQPYTDHVGDVEGQLGLRGVGAVEGNEEVVPRQIVPLVEAVVVPRVVAVRGRRAGKEIEEEEGCQLVLATARVEIWARTDYLPSRLFAYVNSGRTPWAAQASISSLNFFTPRPSPGLTVRSGLSRLYIASRMPRGRAMSLF